MHKSSIAKAGLVVVTALSMAACSSDDGDSTPADSGSELTSAAPQVSDERPAAPVVELLLTTEETPGGGVVSPVDGASAQPELEKLLENQNRQLMEDPACDKIARLESVANHVSTDGASALVSYQQTAEDDTRHHFATSLVPQKLDEFMERSLYEACSTSKSVDNPAETLNVSVADAPEMEGVQGFRVISDIVSTAEDGTTRLRRDISIHGYARGVTASVDYRAVGTDPNVDPVLPTADGALNAIYQAQMNKILNAE